MRIAPTSSSGPGSTRPLRRRWKILPRSTGSVTTSRPSSLIATQLCPSHVTLVTVLGEGSPARALTPQRVHRVLRHRERDAVGLGALDGVDRDSHRPGAEVVPGLEPDVGHFLAREEPPVYVTAVVPVRRGDRAGAAQLG